VSVTAPAGFTAAGRACGIKPSGDPDLALVATDDARPVAAAAVFTSNKATAAPVVTSRAHLARPAGRAAAVVLNSGNANAATGAEGLGHAERTCELVGAHLGCRVEEVLVCSTGLIGVPLPIKAIETGIAPLVASLAGDEDGGLYAARAIMTTDTHAKEAVVTRPSFTIGGMAKGAAMLAPDMATMLAVLTTDAAVEPGALHADLVEAVRGSFNTLTVDGCTSTNDTVIVLASGRAGAPEAGEFRQALAAACVDLAVQMAGDAEGATKVVRIQVTGAASDAEAATAARKVAQSQLVKCSFFGEDPYWGRIVSELGSAGVTFDRDRVSVAYGGVVVAADGVAARHDTAAVKAHLAGRHLEVSADLGMGHGAAWLLTNDLSHGYIDENSRTS
jgi:glutamate N-acetyltransferase/amino-acid N-acetyltransferase